MKLTTAGMDLNYPWFNKNRSCIEIAFNEVENNDNLEFNKNRSCIEIRIVIPLSWLRLLFNKNRSCIEITYMLNLTSLFPV